MVLAHLLNQMCHEALTITDLNAIREELSFCDTNPIARVDRLPWNRARTEFIELQGFDLTETGLDT